MRRMAAFMAPWLEMIAHEHRIEAHPFGLDGVIEEFPRRELFGGRLVAKLQH